MDRGAWQDRNGTNGEREHGARGRMGDEPRKKNPRLLETFCFSLFASVNLKILYCTEVISDSW